MKRMAPMSVLGGIVYAGSVNNFRKGSFIQRCRVSVFAFVLSGSLSVPNALSLQKAQAMMFFNNLDLNIARQEYCQKDYELAEAKSAWYPSIDAFGSYSYQTKKNSIDINLPTIMGLSLGGPMEMGVKDRSDMGVELNYSITGALINASNVKYRQSALSVKSAQDMALRNQLSFKLGTLYFLWDLANSQTNVRKMLVSQFEATVANLKNMEAGGMSSRSKILEAKSGLENAKTQLVAEENRADSLRFELINFIRCDDSAIIPETYDFKLDSALRGEADTFSLDEYRPELTALDVGVDQLNAYKEFLQGKKYPNVLLNAGYHYGRPELQMSNNPDYTGYAIAALQVRFNIFDGNKIISQQQQIQQQIDIARKRKRQAIGDFDNAIKSAKMEYTRAKKQKSAAQVSFQASRAVAEDVKNSLAAGVATHLDYQNALVAQAMAELSVKQAEFMEKTALLKIVFAAGKEIKF